jgi:hypothetical protein
VVGFRTGYPATASWFNKQEGQDIVAKEETVVKVYWSSPRDMMCMTHGGQFPNDLAPAGMESLKGTPIENQLLAAAKVRDEAGNIIGIHTEIEEFGRNGDETDFDVILTILMPGRGALVVRQTKSMSFPEVAGPYEEAMKTGEWNGAVDVVHTSGPLPGRHGEVIGATGEWEGMTGRHQQTAIYRKITPTVIHVDVCETFWLTPKA